MTTLELYDLAERDHIEVLDCPFLDREGVSGIFADGSCVIGLKRPLKAVLAHEMGHCETLSFYDASSPYSSRERCENKADRWAIKQLLPRNELLRAFRTREIWDLAEMFEVDEVLVRKALTLYLYNHI